MAFTLAAARRDLQEESVAAIAIGLPPGGFVCQYFACCCFATALGQHMCTNKDARAHRACTRKSCRCAFQKRTATTGTLAHAHLWKADTYTQSTKATDFSITHTCICKRPPQCCPLRLTRKACTQMGEGQSCSSKQCVTRTLPTSHR